jgi:hypothetical protein
MPAWRLEREHVKEFDKEPQVSMAESAWLRMRPAGPARVCIPPAHKKRAALPDGPPSRHHDITTSHQNL